jgi:hypothetical protein
MSNMINVQDCMGLTCKHNDKGQCKAPYIKISMRRKCMSYRFDIKKNEEQNKLNEDENDTGI